MTRIIAKATVSLALALGLSALAAASSHREPARERAIPQGVQPTTTVDALARELKALQERVAVLEELKPSFTVFMPTYAERFHVMHYAGDAGDWATAAHQAEEMKRLTRVSKYIDPKLGSMLAAFMNGHLGRLEKAIEHGNGKAFQAALESTVQSCNGCHQANGSAITVTLDVRPTMNMRHPHALEESTAAEGHRH